MSSSWLPTWLEVLAAAAFSAVVVIHLSHVFVMAGRSRLWHCGHVLMALGMVDMFWPSSPMPVAASVAEVVFGLGAVAFIAFSVVESRRRASPWLWLVGAVDFAAMVYMFAMMSHRYLPLTLVLVAWFLVEAVAWASGRLAVTAQHCALVLDARDAATGTDDNEVLAAGPQAPDEALSTGHASTSGAAVSTLLPPDLAEQHRAVHATSVRVTLTIMSLGMAYMLLAMQFGMDPMSVMTPGNGPMPTMPGM